MLLSKMLYKPYCQSLTKNLSNMAFGLAMVTFSMPTQANETTLWRTGMAATTAALYLTNALGADIMTVDAGMGNQVYFLRYSARWLAEDNVRLSPYLSIRPSLQVGYSKWQSDIDPDHSATNNVIDLLPIFRWSGPWLPFVDYIDTGLGISIFSSEQISGHKFGGPLQFNDYIGFGWNFGRNDNWELSFRFQHYSNNDIYTDNNGINLPHLSFGYHYR